MSAVTKHLDATHPRPPLDRVLGSREAFGIDEFACAAAGRVIRGFQVEVPSTAIRHRPLSEEILFRISVAAICHQINWDFLSSAMSTAFDQRGNNALFLSSVTSRDLEEWLSGYHRPERIRAKERAALLRDVGTIILADYSGHAELMLELSGGNLYGPGGVASRLDAFRAFSGDPLRKKTNVFIHEIVRDDISRFADEDEIKPAIDYHIMRLYLRSGRVVPLHNETAKILKHPASPPARFVKLLREAASEALSRTALYAGMSIPAVNGVEWEIGREICDRLHPQCNKPAHLSAHGPWSADGKCPYASFCPAFADLELQKLTEPKLQKNFY
jgi:hypothetical protein